MHSHQNSRRTNSGRSSHGNNVYEGGELAPGMFRLRVHHHAAIAQLSVGLKQLPHVLLLSIKRQVPGKKTRLDTVL